MNSSFPLSNNENQTNKYIYCPSGHCLNIPRIKYSNNPLKTEFQFKCECNIDDKNMNLKEFLDKSSSLNCLICLKKITDNKFNFCKNCQMIFDNSCIGYHNKLCSGIPFNENIFNSCLEHKKRYMFRCEECCQSLCIDCGLNIHNEHTLNQISKLSLKNKNIDEIKSIFHKQKTFFEKIKNICNNMMQKLENDIQIKERIINNYDNNKYNYDSYLNMDNLIIYKNDKYEKILEDILKKNEEIKNDNNDIDVNDYINNYLSIFYYSLMINREEEINNSLINDLSKKINNINNQHENLNNNILNLHNSQIIEGKIINSNIEYNKNNSNFSIKSNLDFNNNITPYDKNYFNINELSHTNINNKYNSQIIPQSNDINYNFNNLNFPINNSFSIQNKSLFNFNNQELYNTANYILSKSSEKKHYNKKSEKDKSSKKKKDKKKKSKREEKKKEDEETESDINQDNKKQENLIPKRNSVINNMIILESGNIAISIKEAIEIYDLRKLNFSGANLVYNSEIIKTNCLLQKINIVKGRYISYVLELPDKTLLCATYSKIFRIKLTNNDLNHVFLSFIKLGSEFPTKIIFLEKKFLIVLTEQKKYCNIKIFKKNDKDINEEIIPCSLNNTTANDKNEQINYDDVPAIGNCGLFLKNDIYEDTSFELVSNNVNETKKLFVTIFPIEKKQNNEINSDDNYLYEFIATSNHVFDYTKSRLAFFGLNKENENKFEMIKEITDLSCSIGADSICQINDKYLCIGLQKFELNNQIDGFAFIDIYKREICRIIYAQGVSSIYYNLKNNLLLASMDIKENKKSTFLTKIYKIIQNKGDRGNDDIELKEIYQYQNKHYDTITSIQLMIMPIYKGNLNEQNIKENLIVATSSKDSTLEVVKITI